MSSPRNVNFPSRRLNLAGHLYEPPAGAPDRRRAAVVVGHPLGGVKEQVAGRYAQQLADGGFLVLAFDAAHHGQSDGSPPGLEDPYQRVEDFKCAVSCLQTLEGVVDPERIGVLGIDGSGGYVLSAAQTDKRIKAVATVSAVCVGELARHGLRGHAFSGSTTTMYLHERLVAAGKARTAAAREANLETSAMLTNHVATPPAAPSGTIGPRPINVDIAWSADLQANYDSFVFIEAISPRPVLMVVGSDADTAYLSAHAVRKANDPKELFVVMDKTHAELYDDTTETIPKLVEFLTEHLCA